MLVFPCVTFFADIFEKLKSLHTLRQTLWSITALIPQMCLLPSHTLSLKIITDHSVKHWKVAACTWYDLQRFWWRLAANLWSFLLQRTWMRAEGLISACAPAISSTCQAMLWHRDSTQKIHIMLSGHGKGRAQSEGEQCTGHECKWNCQELYEERGHKVGEVTDLEGERPPKRRSRWRVEGDVGSGCWRRQGNHQESLTVQKLITNGKRPRGECWPEAERAGDADGW